MCNISKAYHPNIYFFYILFSHQISFLLSTELFNNYTPNIIILHHIYLKICTCSSKVWNGYYIIQYTMANGNIIFHLLSLSGHTATYIFSGADIFSRSSAFLSTLRIRRISPTLPYSTTGPSSVSFSILCLL